jgi:hypothetical protein
LQAGDLGREYPGVDSTPDSEAFIEITGVKMGRFFSCRLNKCLIFTI